MDPVAGAVPAPDRAVVEAHLAQLRDAGVIPFARKVDRPTLRKDRLRAKDFMPPA